MTREHATLERKFCPLLERDSDCRFIRSIPAATIRAAWNRDYQYDPVEELRGVDAVTLWECLESGLQFFEPASTAGTAALYERLQTFDFIYREDKYELDYARALVPRGAKVLDVGCAQGAFLARTREERGAEVAGLEFNPRAAAVARTRGIEVNVETVEAHGERVGPIYDVVTNFQVLEHVVRPASFIRGCLACLKPGGLLVLAVPNNDGFLGLVDDNWLNIPPHHLTLWGQKALRTVATLFGLQLQDLHAEPLQEIDVYQAMMFESRHLRGRLRRSLFYRLGFAKAFRAFLVQSARTIPGSTVIAVYTRTPGLTLPEPAP